MLEGGLYLTGFELGWVYEDPKQDLLKFRTTDLRQEWANIIALMSLCHCVKEGARISNMNKFK